MREEGEEINFKHWLSRTIFTMITFFLIILIIDRYTDFDLFIQSFIAVAITIIIGLVHEGLHYREAIKLGYSPVWWRTRFRMGFTINSHSKRDEWLKDKRKIAIAPYIFLIPLTIIILSIGIITNTLGLTIAGIGSLLMHGYTISKEGIERKN